MPRPSMASVSKINASSISKFCHPVANLRSRIGGGRVAAFEVLVANMAVRAMIKDGKTNQIRNFLQNSAREGSQTLEKSLSHLLKTGMVTERDARSRSLYPDEISVR